MFTNSSKEHEKKEDLLVTDLLHLIPILVSDTVVDPLELDFWKELGDWVWCGGLITISWQEKALVCLSLDKGMCGLSIGLDSGVLDLTILVLRSLNLGDNLSTVFHCSIENGLNGVDFESNILDTITVLLKMGVDLLEVGPVSYTHLTLPTSDLV